MQLMPNRAKKGVVRAKKGVVRAKKGVVRATTYRNIHI